jgi:hypothetical protein
MVSIICLIGCVNEDSSDSKLNDYDQGNSVSRNFHGQILDTSGNPISNATVSIGSSSVQTNSNGLFNIQNVTVKEKFAYVKVSKTGFVDGSRVIIPTPGDNRINVMLIPNTTTATINSGTNSEVALPNGTKVKFDGAFKDANGNIYSGIVQVGLYHLKPSNTYLNQIMPGSLLASNSNGDTKILETFGMLHVELKGSSGQKLNLANGHSAEVTFEIDPTQLSSSPQTIPLWSFDEAIGMWKEEGSATKVGNKYVGNVSHFSWWNCDAPFDQCNLTITVNNNSGLPVSNLNVEIIRPSQQYGTNGITNASGQVSGIIPANETLTINIKDYCGNILYTSSIGPFSTNSSNVLPIIILNPSSISTVNIVGTLKTCSNNNVTNGLVKLVNPNTSNFFSAIIQPVTNGAFSFNTSVCGASQVFNLIGEDYTNLQTTGIINFTATAPTTNIGVINACNTINEFITYQVDNNPVNYITYFYAGISPATNGLYIVKNINLPGDFSVNGFNINSIGIYTTTSFSMQFLVTPGSNGSFSNSNVNNVQLIVSQFGPIGGYIDFTINGNYTDSSGNHTFSGTGHVIRDN